MGTNYYHITNEWPVPEHADKRHLGTRFPTDTDSLAFTLHLYPKEGLHTINDIIETLVESGRIEDDCCRCYSLEEFLTIVLTEKHVETYPLAYDTYS